MATLGNVPEMVSREVFQTSFRPLLGLSLGHLSFQSLLEYLIPKTAGLEIERPKVN